MSSQMEDEETPLLQAQKQKKGRTPLPWRQFSIILFLQLSEPLTSQVIAPFAPQVCSSCPLFHTLSSKLLSFQADTGHWHHEWRRNSSWILCRIAGASSVFVPSWVLKSVFSCHSIPCSLRRKPSLCCIGVGSRTTSAESLSS